MASKSIIEKAIKELSPRDVAKIWTARELRKRTGITSMELYKLEKKGAISRARRTATGYREWFTSEIRILLAQVLRYEHLNYKYRRPPIDYT